MFQTIGRLIVWLGGYVVLRKPLQRSKVETCRPHHLKHHSPFRSTFHPMTTVYHVLYPNSLALAHVPPSSCNNPIFAHSLTHLSSVSASCPLSKPTRNLLSQTS